MPAPAYRQRQLVLARKADRRHNVGDVGAGGNQRRTPVNHSVVNFARRFVGVVALSSHSAAQLRA